MSETALATDAQVITTDESKLRKIARALGWTAFAVFCLLLFTVVKVPQARLHQYLVGTINQQLASSGMQLQADEGKLSFFLTPSYEMTGVKLVKTAGNQVLKLSQVEVSPAWLGLLQGKLGANVRIEEGSGFFTLRFLGSRTSSESDVSFTISSMNLGRMGALPFLAGLGGTAEISGDGQISGDLSSPASWNGNLKLNLAKLTLDQQKMMGMDIPAVRVSEGLIDVGFAASKATVKSFRLGKGSDDLILNLTGDARLMRSIESSDVNLKGKLGFSPAVLKSFGFLDTILSAAKQPDGSYKIKMVGPLGQAIPQADQ